MTLRHLIAEQVLLDGEFAPAHLEIIGGEIIRIHRLSSGEARRRAEIVKASDIGAGAGMTVVDPRHQVLPGNVDTHVHINEPGRTSWEGFATGTMAAALGGVTAVVDMPLNSIPPTVDVASLQIKKQAAAGQIFVDVGFWGGIVPGNIGALRPLWDAGVFGFKCFLLPSGVDEFPPVNGVQLREAMTEVASFDGLVIVHAEDAETIERATELTGRRRRLSHYADWAQTRPHDAEVAAISDLIEAVRETGCRTHILHLASARALDIIADARAEGLPLTVETCPHYLCFDADAIPDGAAEFKCCPPIRDRGNREALWDGLREGIIDAVVSDHSPSTAEEKHRGAPDLQQAWGGISGLQVGFSAVAHEARLRGIGIETVSTWMATHTALLAGLPRKGRIGLGMDADLVIYDPRQTNMVSAAGLAHKNPISAYDHYEITGAVVGAVLRGTALYTSQDTTTPLAPAGGFLQGLGSPELSALRR